jgi:hypothetical protein
MKPMSLPPDEEMIVYDKNYTYYEYCAKMRYNE